MAFGRNLLYSRIVGGELDLRLHWRVVPPVALQSLWLAPAAAQHARHAVGAHAENHTFALTAIETPNLNRSVLLIYSLAVLSLTCLSDIHLPRDTQKRKRLSDSVGEAFSFCGM
jgi:hypothetical protein